jgi:cytidylate kinase
MGQRIIGLDGHDGTGKTTLAQLLAQRLHGRYVRTFGAQWGVDLMRAHEQHDDALTVEIGMAALQAAVASASTDEVLILDRSWITVRSLVGAELFAQRWSLQVPTILCWADLPTTLARLELRHDEAGQTTAYHRRYLALYWRCARRGQCPILRTDLGTTAENLAALERLAANLVT